MADMVIENNLLSIHSTYAEHYAVNACYFTGYTTINNAPYVARIGFAFKQAGTSGYNNQLYRTQPTNYKLQTKVLIMY